MQILVVDDSKTIRYMLVHMLKELGYETIAEAADVEAAMNQIQMNPPDLIFSDFNMPGKSGLDFLKLVRQHSTIAKVPFIMVTTMHDKKVIFDAVKAGAQYYILKPVEKNVLVEKLTALTESHHIQAPRKAAATTFQPVEPDKKTSAKATAPAENKQEISPEIRDSIVEHFFLVFDGEMTMPDFQAWATENILPHVPIECKFKTAQQLLELLRSAARDGINLALK